MDALSSPHYPQYSPFTSTHPFPKQDDLAAQLCDRTRELECLRRELDECKQEACCLRDTNKSLEDKVCELNNEMERMSCEATKELEEQDEELCRLRRNVESMQCTINQQNQEIDELTAELRDTNNQLRCVQSDLVAQQESYKQLEMKFENYIRCHRYNTSHTVIMSQVS